MKEPIRLDRIKPERVQWLPTVPPERIPLGDITVIAGRVDQGKGLLAAAIAAHASRQGIRVLYSAAEDSAGTMTRPRLEAAGAIQTNILVWRFKLPKQWVELANLIVSQHIGLVVIDPIASHLSNGVTRHSDNIRTVTDPLTELTQKTKTSVIVVEHVVKGRRGIGDDPINAIGGSGSGLVAAARAAYLLGTDPQDSDRRIMACLKLNVGREKPPAAAFEMDFVEQQEVGQQPKLVFDEEIDFDPMRMLIKPKGSIGRPPDKRASAAEWLTNYLAAAGKPVKSKVIFEDAKQYGMTVRTLRRAADQDVKVVKSGGGGPNVTWELPQELKEVLGIAEPQQGFYVPDGDVDGEPLEDPPISPDDNWDEALSDLLNKDDGEEDSDD